MTEAIVLEFEVAKPVAHVFSTWTENTRLWWPRPHTVTQDPSATIVFEPGVGGRIFERAVDGAEHEWGEVTLWDPPSRVRYLWHIFLDRDQATTVELEFTPTQTGSRIRLVQDGFDVFADGAEERRERVVVGWSEIARVFGDYLTG